MSFCSHLEPPRIHRLIPVSPQKQALALGRRNVKTPSNQILSSELNSIFFPVGDSICCTHKMLPDLSGVRFWLLVGQTHKSPNSQLESSCLLPEHSLLTAQFVSLSLLPCLNITALAGFPLAASDIQKKLTPTPPQPPWQPTWFVTDGPDPSMTI